MTIETKYSKAYNDAVSQLEKACHDKGILASTLDQDNYKKVWSRDAIIAGVAGLLINNERITQSFKQALLLLAKHQLIKGTIPSNVMEDGNNTTTVSHGSLAGRVDATSWFIIGACLYIKKTNDDAFKHQLLPHIEKGLHILDCWEYNNKHLTYTPLSGNWADEYPLHGYLLYDNVLRYWAMKLYGQLLDHNDAYLFKLRQIEEAIKINFWPEHNQVNKVYHEKLFLKEAEQALSYFRTGFTPANYYHMFDASANGLMLLLNLATTEQENQIGNFMTSLFASLGHDLVPAFWPPIKPGDDLWNDLENNYAYDFKNKPHHFHNGGIWPVMMGILCMGLSQSSLSEYCKTIYDAYLKLALMDGMNFSEYIESENFTLSGKKEMSFSASGTIFMHLSIFENQSIKSILTHDR